MNINDIRVNPETTRSISGAIRLISIIGQFIGGIFLSIGLVGFGLLIHFSAEAEKRSPILLALFLVAAVAAFVVSSVQLYRRLTQRKNQSTNLAYEATDGNVAVNKPSSIDHQVSANQLENESIKSWAGPVFSNQNAHIVWLAVDTSPNTENTLILTENYIIGLLIGPARDSTAVTTNVLNALPIDATSKNAFGAIFDNKNSKQNIEKELGSKQLPQLVQEYAGFTLPLSEIEKVSFGNHTLKVRLRSGKNRSWVTGKQDGQLNALYLEIQARLHGQQQ